MRILVTSNACQGGVARCAERGGVTLKCSTPALRPTDAASPISGFLYYSAREPKATTHKLTLCYELAADFADLYREYGIKQAESRSRKSKRYGRAEAEGKLNPTSLISSRAPTHPSGEGRDEVRQS
jgi:hypothetical protein